MSSSGDSSDSENSAVYHTKATSISYDSLDVSIFKGKQFLAENAGNHVSITNTNVKLRDNFSQLLIWEVTKNK